MTDRRTRLAIVPLLALLVLPACAWVNAPPTLAVEGRLALYGVQVQRATQAMLEAAVLAAETARRGEPGAGAADRTSQHQSGARRLRRRGVPSPRRTAGQYRRARCCDHRD